MPVVELSPAERERLRQLEEEVDQERERLRKELEAFDQRTPVPAQEPRSEPTAVVPRAESKEEVSLTTSVTTALAKASIRQKIAVGTGVILVGFAVLQNLALIIASAVVAGSVWYLSGKLSDDTPKPSPTPKKDGKDPRSPTS